MFGALINQPNYRFLGIEECKTDMIDEDGQPTPEQNREFFARCITGYLYDDQQTMSDPLNSIRNCYIRMLNSKVIDVDKLDYLMRDTYVTGFKTTNIDYERLLTALTVLKEREQYRLAYNRGAISVVENIIYAHDAERKWIQTHPIVLYENFLLRHIMNDLNSRLQTESSCLFSIESISPHGVSLKDGLVIRSLCDDDIVYLAKNDKNRSPAAQEYFSRKERRHPVWKSEAEYSAYVLRFSGRGTELTDQFLSVMNAICDSLLVSSDTMAINLKRIRSLEAEINELQSESADNDAFGDDDESRAVQLKKKRLVLRIFKCLQRFAESKSIECDFVVLSAKQFSSGFSGEAFGSLPIVFDAKDGQRSRPFSEIVTSLADPNVAKEDYFYLFYKRQSSQESLTDADAEEIGRQLVLAVGYDD